MPLSEESDPFARRHFAGSSGGETVPPWNGASGTRAGCLVRVDQVQPEPVPDGPGPDQHREGPAPASISSRNEKARVNGLRRPPWLFFCPRPAPIGTAARSAPGRTAPPTVTACPICPAWAVSACPMSSGPPARSPARPTPSSRTPPPPCCPHPCQTYRQRQPPARQHPAASPTPEGSDSPPNGIEL